MHNETLSWDITVALYGESVLIDNGYKTRMHADKECTNRLGDTALIGRKVDSAPASNLCSDCTGELVATSISSSVVMLRDLKRQLQRAEDTAEVRSTAVTLARRIWEVESIHPEFEDLHKEVLAEAEQLAVDLPVYH